jgi:hypothetical protein
MRGQHDLSSGYTTIERGVAGIISVGLLSFITLSFGAFELANFIESYQVIWE